MITSIALVGQTLMVRAVKSDHQHSIGWPDPDGPGGKSDSSIALVGQTPMVRAVKSDHQHSIGWPDPDGPGG